MVSASRINLALLLRRKRGVFISYYVLGFVNINVDRLVLSIYSSQPSAMRLGDFDVTLNDVILSEKIC